MVAQLVKKKKKSACSERDLGSIPGSGRSAGEGIGLYCRIPTAVILGFPVSSVGNESARNVGDQGSIPGLGGFPLQYSSLENPHGQRSWAGYSPRGHTESDMTK